LTHPKSESRSALRSSLHRRPHPSELERGAHFRRRFAQRSTPNQL